MKNRRMFWLLIGVLVIPSIAFGVAQGMLAYESNQFHQGVVAEFAKIQNPTPDQQKLNDLLGNISTEELCGPAFRAAAKDFEDYCTESIDPLVMMSTAAEIAGVVGVGLIFAIAIFGLLARSSRTLLVLLFLPGLYLTLASLVLLVALHAAC